MRADGTIWDRADRGASAVEYALVLAAIAATVTAIVFALGLVNGGFFDRTCGRISSADHTATSC